MTAFLIIIAIMAGIVIATFVNFVVVKNIEETQKIVMRIISYIVCILLSTSFLFFATLRKTVDNFLNKKIAYVEKNIKELLPDYDIMNAGIDVADFSNMLIELQNIIENNDEISDEDNFFQALIVNILVKNIQKYIDMAQSYIEIAENFSEIEGKITVKSILLGIKEEALNIVSPYFKIGQYITVFLFIVYAITYICLVLYFTKGRALYNKSIVFGEIDYNEKEKKHTKEGE
jgi:hypothetical protein